jgi:integrase
MRTRRTGMGRIFRRRSRTTGKPLPTWWVAYYVKGADGRAREVRESAETTDHDEAKLFLRKRLGEAAPATAKRVLAERLTVAELLQLLVADYADRGKAVPPGHVEALTAALGGTRAVDVERAHLDELVRTWKVTGPRWPGRPCWCRRRGCDELAHQAKPHPISAATCNRYMATLRAAYGIGREKIAAFRYELTFPTAPEKARGRYIPPADFAKIVAHMPSAAKRLFCEFAYLTGVRKGQLRATELANVDTQAWVIRWRPDQTKAEDAHELPLVGRTRAIVEDLWTARRLDCRYLFHEDGKPLGTLRSEWSRACRAAGFRPGRVHGYTFHDTRHSAVSNLHAAGVADSVAMAISNHATPSVFLRYGIQQDATKRAALEAVQRHLAELATAAESTPVRALPVQRG